MPTIVQTLVSPISTCQSAPDDAPASLPEPRLLPEPAEPADVGRLRPFWDTDLDIDDKVLPLEDPDPRLPFLTRPPSLDGNSVGSGDVGALLPVAPELK